jgi:glycosyltransferase involved in cell wall biosynthesis
VSSKHNEGNSNTGTAGVLLIYPSNGGLFHYSRHLASSLEREGVQVARLEVYFTSVLSFLRTLWSAMTSQPSVVHINAHMLSWSRSRFLNGLASLYPTILRLSGKRVVVTLHNMPDFIDFEKISSEYRIGRLARIAGSLAVWLYCRSNIVCVTVRGYDQFLRAKYGARTVFVEHGCYEPNEFSNSKRGDILSFGYITPYKDYETLFRAFKRVALLDPSVHLVIAGTSHPSFPDMLTNVKNAAANIPNLSFVGFVDEANLGSLFDSAAAVVLPYITSTGTSGAFHMACCHGRAVIASDTPEFRALVKEGAAALIFQRSNAQDLAEKMVQLLRSEDLRHEMETLNFKFASENSLQRSSERYAEIYAGTRVGSEASISPNRRKS